SIVLGVCSLDPWHSQWCGVGGVCVGPFLALGTPTSLIVSDLGIVCTLVALPNRRVAWPPGGSHDNRLLCCSCWVISWRETVVSRATWRSVWLVVLPISYSLG